MFAEKEEEFVGETIGSEASEEDEELGEDTRFKLPIDWAISV